ncbi:HNH endonuclease [Actinomadura decatromicini]|uniref:HNH endonuclease n=1 Tax=Actinomadura decatromicini TaxID=2604572 RepID=A0A5D3F826_9ACTN|nr:HNH endonuclease [Actinomadura decatromicini]TYK45167.1 HNH endonuclease [Actinomadura decatromicini]
MPNGQWKTSTRKATLPTGWDKIRRRILTRDNHTCYKCGNHATHVDHVANSAAGGDDSDANLAAICFDCHQTKSSAEGGRAAQARKPKRTRPAEAHPGIVR